MGQGQPIQLDNDFQIEREHREHNGELLLWLSVVQRAVLDARSVNSRSNFSCLDKISSLGVRNKIKTDLLIWSDPNNLEVGSLSWIAHQFLAMEADHFIHMIRKLINYESRLLTLVK